MSDRRNSVEALPWYAEQSNNYIYLACSNKIGNPTRVQDRFPVKHSLISIDGQVYDHLCPLVLL